MLIHSDKSEKVNDPFQKPVKANSQANAKSPFQFVDNRSETMLQKTMQQMADKTKGDMDDQLFNPKQKMRENYGVSQFKKSVGMNVGSSDLVKQPNDTGLPNQLKSGIENLSGYSMDDVKVHYNSGKPAQLQAHAFAQGTDIHLASGQEKHLAHEAWHVVQQKQGRVKPTLQMKGGVSINDDHGLEREADLMGQKAEQNDGDFQDSQLIENPRLTHLSIQKKQIIQLVLSEEQLIDFYNEKLYQGKILSEILEENDYLDDDEKEQLGTYFYNRDKDLAKSKRVKDALDSIDKSTKMSRWDYDGKTYHLNFTTETHHVTEEGNPKKHYFFEGTGADIQPKQCTPEERGRNSKESKFTFSSLPEEVRDFVKTYWYKL
ncbi:eCIS core domain-containing protein [Algoriphagus marincola]|uniref:eCIS core domain-containing protein n=1 Tax=Algoriphagus marincola TaxID=264027 RepID=UPI0004037F04|nr:DUF4157 domain-containing protein [Algoriphagus marincola]